MQKLKYCLLALLWPVMNGLAQTPPQQIHAIAIGEKLPDIVLTNLYNYASSSVHLSSLKGKMIILDFWSTWCGSCIEAFPKMHHLQKEFDGELQVFLVNTFAGDSIQKVKPFFQRRSAGTGEKITLPYSLLQMPVSPYFPYRFIPHYVWIDKSGKVIAITSQFEVTSSNIRSALTGNTAGIRTKKDMLDFDNSKPLFVKGNGGDGDGFVYRSVFTNYIEGLGNVGGIERTKDGRITRLYQVNISLLDLLRTAYPGKLELPGNRIIQETKEANKFRYGSTEDTLLYTNACCYDLTVPPATMKEVELFMQQDIFRIFHIRVKNEERSMPCLIIKLAENNASCLTKGGRQEIDITKSSLRKYLQNQPLTVLAEILNNHVATQQMPVIVSDDVRQHIDLDFPPGFDTMNIETLRTFLINAGLLLTQEDRKITVAVITE